MRISTMMASVALCFAVGASDVSATPRAETGRVATASIQAPSASLLALQDPQPVTQPPAGGEVQLDVEVNDGSAWYTDPVWIVIGIAALVVIVALIAMAGRGGGTTVVR
ncbi:MAG TPA: hypothetical protein VLE53_15275 [Gemmatimonadaceae bacterium]|nr:hypothetical protein [Gemmatimonadaceae bacterium]